MDAVILAAGRGARMSSVVPPYHKPLLEVVRGQPLVRWHVQAALDIGVETPVVVVAPQNAELIDTALGDLPAKLVIQRRPCGPGHALLLGLCVEPQPFQTSDRVLVLLADNVVTHEDIMAITDTHGTSVGVRFTSRADAHRFTRYEGGNWLEHTPLTDATPDPVPCWVGPFLGWRQPMMRTLRHVVRKAESAHTEALIGPYLNELCGYHKLVQVSSIDVGTPEAYRAATTEGESA